MHFALINQSTVVTDKDCHAISKALNIQATQFAHIWERLQPTMSFHKDLTEIPKDFVRMTILDNPDQAGALGYHTVGPDGEPTSKIFAKLMKTVLTGGLSVSACCSHEFLEAFGDPTCLLWDEYDDAGHQIAHELADPVQDDTYEIDTGTYGKVSVSNFVLPSYFNPWSIGPWDHMGRLKGPAPKLSPGGYAVISTGSGEKQILGEVPDWKAGIENNRTAARTL